MHSAAMSLSTSFLHLQKNMLTEILTSMGSSHKAHNKKFSYALNLIN